MKKNKKHILIIGPIPPPFGGVCVHIMRLYHMFEHLYQFDFIDEFALRKPQYFNIRSKRLDIYLTKIFNSELIFIHSGTNLLRILHVLISKLFGKKVLLTIHSYPKKKSFIKRQLDRCFYSLADKVILVNNSIVDRLGISSRKILIKDAFLPPVLQNEPPVPGFVIDWIHLKRNDNLIIVTANASKLEMFDGEDLYGLDMCITAIERNYRNNGNLALVFNVSDSDKYNDVYRKYQHEIQVKGLDDRILLISEQLSFYRLMMLSDVVIRPTNTDGDSLTVREALHLQLPIIASDIVARPIGTILFETRNNDSLEKVLGDVVNSKIDQHKIVGDSDRVPEDYFDFYQKLFHSFFKNDF